MTEREKGQDDALAFAAWLTSRPGVLTVGSGEECGPLAEAVAEWRKANPLRAPASEGEAWVQAMLEAEALEMLNYFGAHDLHSNTDYKAAAERFASRVAAALATHPAPATVTEAMIEREWNRGAVNPMWDTLRNRERDGVIAFAGNLTAALGGAR